MHLPCFTQPARKPERKTGASKADIVAELRSLERPLRERGLQSLALFGSVARGDVRPDSDVDVLVDIAADVPFSLVDLVAVKDFLEERLGRPVDVVTKKGLEPLIRERVLREAETMF